MPYVIRNCPAILRMTKICDAYETTRDLPQFCKDCADCVLKRIVELCKEAIKDCDKCKGDPETDCYDCTQGGKAIQSDKILELFDIEECE